METSTNINTKMLDKSIIQHSQSSSSNANLDLENINNNKKKCVFPTRRTKMRPLPILDDDADNDKQSKSSHVLAKSLSRKNIQSNSTKNQKTNLKGTFFYGFTFSYVIFSWGF